MSAITHHPHPRVQRKMEVLWLKSQGVGPKKMGRLSGVSATTLTRDIFAAMATMERLTGLKRSENRGREFLKAMGLKLRKLGLVPAKADAEMQEGFKKSRTVNSA